MKPFKSLLTLSETLLLCVKTKKDSSDIEHELSRMALTELYSQLSTDQEKNTFWINIYNAYFQILAGRDHTQGKHIFKVKTITIARTHFSLDDIEHGILRKYRWKKSLGYLPNLFVAPLIKKLAVRAVDYRIHFALNCGAKSCPPIAFYTLDKLDQQLDDAMYAFLSSETTVNSETKTIQTSKLLFWYQGDFGGLKGVRYMLKTVLSIENNSYALKYNSYSWEPQLENYV
ncbi:DUF547 domain-containing protein [Formosa sp. 4Alg 33]|uniref:DUF547 domain-containing protein n=1 Tax=Formosa sp. 4Alg 33 TaxID=3382189 RepID=UPI003D9C5447